MESKIVKIDEVDINLRAREWCKLPYPNHPNGCPNYSVREDCPPKAPIWNEYIECPCILVGLKFNLKEWIENMKAKHPNWSERQCKCCLYWQGKVRKELRNICNKIKGKDESLFISYTPEAMGVQVINTAVKAGLDVKVKPKDYVWKIAIIGKLKNCNKVGGLDKWLK